MHTKSSTSRPRTVTMAYRTVVSYVLTPDRPVIPPYGGLSAGIAEFKSTVLYNQANHTFRPYSVTETRASTSVQIVATTRML